MIKFLLISWHRICSKFVIPFTSSHQHICSSVSYLNPLTLQENIRYGLLYRGLQRWGSIELMLCTKSDVNGKLEANIRVLLQVTPDRGCLSAAYQWARWTGLLANKNCKKVLLTKRWFHWHVYDWCREVWISLGFEKQQHASHHWLYNVRYTKHNTFVAANNVLKGQSDW